MGFTNAGRTPESYDVGHLASDKPESTSGEGAARIMGEKTFVIEPGGIDQLLSKLAQEGYEVVGPTVRQGAIVYDRITSASDMPAGWTAIQDAGTYRLTRRSDDALFAYAGGPQSWKKYLLPPRLTLWQARKDRTGWVEHSEVEPKRYALVGVRSCELHAIAIQDKVFLQGKYVDPYYRRQREGLFIVAVNCTEAGGTCFCASMKTGPRATSGYDLALTEITGNPHYFLAEAGSEKGQHLLEGLETRKALPGEQAEAERRIARTAESMGRSLETSGVQEMLYANYENAHWDEVASRCLSCANCTLVCPTCFCNSTEDTTDLSGKEATRGRRWDSCFTLAYSYIHGGSVRASRKARYRQWLTHKFAAWSDQFGVLGCVGCGRCITWCPAGIDNTKEVKAIRESQMIVVGPPRKGVADDPKS